MPNWATGTLKIRGCTDEILRFCNDILSRQAGDNGGEVVWRLCDEDDEFCEDDTLIATIRNDARFCVWLKDSNRHFIDMDLEVPYYWDFDKKRIAGTEDQYEYRTAFNTYRMPKNEDGTEDCLVVFPFMAAWGFREEYFEKLSQDFRLEFKVYVVEQGVGYYEEAQFKDGKAVKFISGPNLKDQNGEYGQFVWECPFPFLGG